MSADSVDYVVLTRIDLDHDRGAEETIGVFNNARLMVHPRGVRHMVYPGKVVAGVTAACGEAEVRRLYGDIVPIEEHRIIPAMHGLRVDLAGRELLCLDIPGRARHNMCLVDRRSGNSFRSDVFGLSYRELDTDGRPFIFPTTTRVQFDPEAVHASIEFLLTYEPGCAGSCRVAAVSVGGSTGRLLEELGQDKLDLQTGGVALIPQGRLPGADQRRATRRKKTRRGGGTCFAAAFVVFDLLLAGMPNIASRAAIAAARAAAWEANWPGGAKSGQY